MECGYFTPEIYTAGDGIDITNNVISAEVPENPIHRITLSTFDAAAFTAAQTAHNAGKLVLLDDDTRNFHNLSLLGIYTDFSQETDGQGNPVPFMAFNKVDAWVDGNRSVYDGRNYQLYASGNVYTSNPYLEYTQQSSGPVLNNFWLGLNGTEIAGNGGLVGSINQENKYVWQWSGSLSQAITASTNYNYSIEGGYNGSNFGDNSGGQFTWESQLGFWRLNNGPSIIRIVPDGGDQTATQAQIIVIYDPSWRPGPSSAPDLNTLWVGYGDNPTVNMVDINNASIGGSVNNNKFMWNIEGVTLPEAFQAQNYGYNFVAGNISTSGGGTAYWVDETDFHAWVLENGATKMYVAPQGSSQTEVMIRVEFDPNWQPPASTVEGVSLVDVSSGNSLYNASNLGITDVGGVWTINGAQLSSALSSGQELDVSINGSNVPSVSNSRVSLAAIPDTPNLTATASPWTMTFYLQSGNAYNISLTIGGQN